MKNSFLITLFLLLFVGCTTNVSTKKDLKLWYNEPAKAWTGALPLGNGRIGAMVYGNPLNEVYKLNEETVWSGAPRDWNNPEALKALPKVRKLIDSGRYNEASKLIQEKMYGTYTSRYLPLTDLHIDMLGLENPSNYYRELNISNATNKVKFEVDGVEYTRTSFISYPDQVMVIKIDANKPDALNFDISMSINPDMAKFARVVADTSNRNILIYKAKAPKYVAHRAYEPKQIVFADTEDGEGTNFEVHTRVLVNKGTSDLNDNILSVRNANSATIYLTVGTSYNGFDKSPGLNGVDPSIRAYNEMEIAVEKGHDALLMNHVADYKNLFDRVELRLDGDNNKDSIDTDSRLKTFKDNPTDNKFINLFYQYGRYLMISSSREGGLPSNLQGIWNKDVKPAWGSNYTMNINTEMNYWPAEITGLQECHEPLLNFIKNLSVNGAKTAKVNYGINNAWVSHHNSDIWAQTSPVGIIDKNRSNVNVARFSMWPMSGGWFSQHLWEHYTFNGDTAYLKNDAYLVMKGAANFMLQWLHKDNATDYLVTSPSTSPENTFKYDNNGEYKIGDVAKASTMDMAIIWDLFSNCIKASEILNIDEDFRKELISAKSKLYPLHIGSKGQLQEWHKDFADTDPKHRHVSHLFALHPGKEILPRINPDLASAAKKTLELRGDGGTGWAMAWKVNFWARLEDGNHAFLMLKNALNYVKETDSNNVSAGGAYPNLFDAHAPFQIDGNFGVTAGITEMLVQSHGGEIFLLPALPSNWPSGSVKGIRTRGGFIVDMAWQNEKLTNLKVHSTLGGNCRIRTATQLKLEELSNDKSENSNPLNYIYTDVNYITNDSVTLVKEDYKKTYLYDKETKAGRSYNFKIK